MHSKTRRPSAGTLIGTVALVFALTGAAVALPGKNSVDTGDIRKNAIKSKHIKNGKVGGADLNANSVGNLFGSGVLTGAGTAPPVGGNLASIADLPATGSGDAFEMPAPRGGLTVRDLVATIETPSVRPVVVGFERNNDNAFLSCQIPIGLTSCQSAAGDRLHLDAGDTLDGRLTVVPTPVAVGATNVSFAYRAVAG